MKYLIILFLFLNATSISCQINCYQDTVINQQQNQISFAAKSIGSSKTIRINFHYIRKDANSNFTETSDGMGNPYNGYEFSRNMVEYMNYSQSYNVPLNIPAGNSLPVLNKNFNYVLDGVYFHLSPGLYNYGSSLNTQLHSQLGVDKPNVLNVYVNCCGDGRVSSFALNQNENALKFVETGLPWKWYRDRVLAGQASPLELWRFSLPANHICHELGHLLGLYHTVLTPGGFPCPTTNGANCGDDCSDTPSAFEMISVHNSPIHPNCTYNDVSSGCSNNLMDYSNHNSLSPCQIEKVHAGLENGLNPYTTCYAVSIDKSICDLGYPKLAHFGKDITIGGCSNPPFALEGNEKVDIYFSNSVEFFTTELAGNSELEVIYEPTCNF